MKKKKNTKQSYFYQDYFSVFLTVS